MARLIAVDIVATTEMLIELGVVFFFAAHQLYQAGNVMHDGPGIDPGVAFSPSVFRIRPGSIKISGLHKTSRLIKEVLIVMRTVEKELVFLRFTQRLSYLRYAPVVVRIFHCSRRRLRRLIGRDIPEHLQISKTATGLVRRMRFTVVPAAGCIAIG